MEWKPIKDAPKDGTAFLGYFPGGEVYAARLDVKVIYWSGWGGGNWAVNGHNGADQPTHFMPIPAPPEPTHD